MATIIGVLQTAFTTKDGNAISGTTLYVTEPIPANRGKGSSADKVFLSSTKLAEQDFVPAVGQEVDVLFNKFGKVAKLVLKDEPIP